MPPARAAKYNALELMNALSPAYQEIKRLRSSGACAAAISAMRAHRPSCDADAFEAVVCLFVAGEVDNALQVCRTHAWREQWASQITAAVTERLRTGDTERALALAKSAASSAAAPYDAVAIYLLLLQESGRLEEARAYAAARVPHLPLEETFLLTMLAELAVAAGDWRQAYRAASAVLAADPDDFRALLAASTANYGIGNFHEALGNAQRALLANKQSVAAILQIMRCENKLGDYYAVLAAFGAIGEQSALRAYLEVHGARPKRVPYRANRCVLFDSSLIHITDEMRFKPGYENRRVNVTLFYGRARAVE